MSAQGGPSMQEQKGETMDGDQGAVAGVEQRVQDLMAARYYDERGVNTGALPREPRYRVDIGALPASVAAKVRAREAVFGVSPSARVEGYHQAPRRNDRLCSVVSWGLLLGSVPLGLWLGAVELPGVVKVLLWSLPFAVVVLVLVGDWWLRHFGPEALTGDEMYMVQRNTTLAVPFDVPYRIDRQEDALWIVAVEAIVAIKNSPSWRSRYFDLHRIHLNLDEESYQLVDSCMNLAKLGDLIAEATPAASESSVLDQQLSAVVSDYKICYAQARGAVANRIAALIEYGNRLNDVDSVFGSVEKASALATGTDNFSATFIAIARDESAAQQARALGGDALSELQANLQSQLALVCGQIGGAAPVSAPPVGAESSRNSGSEVPGRTAGPCVRRNESVKGDGYGLGQ